MKWKVVGTVVVLIMVVAGGLTWRHAHRDDGTGPWVPAVAVVSCSGVHVRPLFGQGPTEQWSSGITRSGVPERWRGISGEIAGEFRRIPDSSSRFGRLRAEFRSGDVTVELSTVSVDCR